MNKIYYRSVFIAPKGYSLISVDLSQAESWIVAYLANEPNMKWSLHNSDIHRDTAGDAIFYPVIDHKHEWEPIKGPAKCKICGVEVVKTARYIGKRVNHATAYRMNPFRMAEVINKDSDKPPYVTVTLEETKTYYTNWHKFYNIKPWWDEIEWKLNTQGRTLTTPYGFRRTFYERWGDELFKEATAFVPQSTVADHFNGRVHKELGIRGGLQEIFKHLILPYKQHRIVNQSHDSCIIECPSDIGKELAQRAMSLLSRPLIVNGQQFTIPVDGEIGERWGELEEIKMEN